MRRFAEFLVTGGATLALYPLSWIVRRAFGLDDAEFATGFFFFYLAFLVNDPRFAVTYLLFYRDARARAFSPSFSRAQRWRWLFSGVVVPTALAVWAGAALTARSAPMLGAMIQAMYLLVGWHYVKQGFGAFMVLASRRGVRVSTTERRVVLFHGYAGWAYAWASPAVPAGDYEEKGVIYSALAHPRWLEIATGAVFALSTVALVAVLVARKRTTGRFLPLAPLVGLLASVWAWSIYSSIDPLVRYAVPALHSLQYLYFVWLLRHNEARAHEGPPSFGRPAAVRVAFLALGALGLGWILFHAAPEFLDTAFASKRGDLGLTPFFAALYVIVNIHHYFMDHVIWRRENPETKYLQEPVEQRLAA